MVIKKKHAALLLRLSDKWKEGIGLDKIVDKLSDEDLAYLEHLYLAGLIDEDDGTYTLTYSGELILDVLENLIKEGKLKDVEMWDDSFRWIGSEVIAMIEVGLISRGEVDDNIKKALSERGFISDDGVLSPYASSVWDAYNEADVKLRITSKIGDYIKKIPPGPGFAKHLPKGLDELLTLESMRLIAFSVPTSDVYSLTGLGQQIRAALLNGTPFGDVYINEEMLDIVVELNDENIRGEGALLERMQSLGYIDSSNRLLPAGKHLLSAARIYYDGPITTNPSVHFTKEELFILSKIKELSGNDATTVKTLKEITDKEFSDYDVYEGIYTLESYRLIKPVVAQDGNIGYVLTNKGEETLKIINSDKTVEIDALGVKAITVTRMEYSAPDVKWLEIAEKEGLVGKAYPSKKGRFMAEIATRTVKYPYITGEMREILELVPYEKGITLKKLIELSGKEESKVFYLLERLDAQGVVDALPDNVYTLTEIGRLIKRAIRAVPQGTKHVVTPTLSRILLALWDLSDRNRRIMVSENLKKVEKMLDLPREVIEREILTGKRNRFLNDKVVLEPGKVLLDALTLYEDIRDIWEEVLV